MDPRAWNRFSYVYGNPVNLVDPSGHIAIAPWDILDIVSFGASLNDFIQDPSLANAGWLALDTISLLPLIPAVGAIHHAGKLSDAEKIDDIYRVLRSTEAGEEIYQKAHNLGLPEVIFDASLSPKKPGYFDEARNQIHLSTKFRSLPSELATPTLAHELYHRTRRWHSASKLQEFGAHKIQARVWAELRSRVNPTNLFFRGTSTFKNNEEILGALTRNRLMGYLNSKPSYRMLPLAGEDLALDSAWEYVYRISENP